MRNWIHTAHFNARARDLGYADFESAIRALYADGHSENQIAAALDMCHQTVMLHLKQLQMPRRPCGGWSTTRPRIIITYQGRDWTTSELAEHLGTYRELALKMVRAGRVPGARFEKRSVT